MTTRAAGRTQHRLVALATLAFAAVVALLAWRAFGARGGPDDWVLVDFRNTVYYPARAFLDGGNPYDDDRYRARYPATHFPPFAPISLAVYAPLASLPLATAERVWFAGTAVGTVGLAWVARRGFPVAAVPAVATALLLSRPGQMNLLLGQQTIPLVLGAYAAWLLAGSRPRLAALGLAVSSFKPQFAVPLALLLAAAGHLGVAAAGLAMSGIASLAVLMMMPPQPGLSPLATFVAAATGSAARIEDAAGTWWSRLDGAYLAHHLIGASHAAVEATIAIGLLGVGCVAVRRLGRRAVDGDGALAIGVACTTMLLCVYHQAYDALLLALPIGALARSTRRDRRLLIALLAVPFANYLATWSAIQRLGIAGPAWTLVTALNPFVLSIAWAILVRAAFTRRHQFA